MHKRFKEIGDLPEQHRAAAAAQVGKMAKSKPSKFRNKPCFLCPTHTIDSVIGHFYIGSGSGIYVIAEFHEGKYEKYYNHGTGEYICPLAGCSHVFTKEDRFDSKLEARVYLRLCGEHGKENIIRQVTIPLGGGASLRPDFFVITDRFADGSFRVKLMDGKGKPTRDWTNKNKWLKQKYTIGIEPIKK